MADNGHANCSSSMEIRPSVQAVAVLKGMACHSEPPATGAGPATENPSFCAGAHPRCGPPSGSYWYSMRRRPSSCVWITCISLCSAHTQIAVSSATVVAVAFVFKYRYLIVFNVAGHLPVGQQVDGSVAIESFAGLPWRLFGEPSLFRVFLVNSHWQVELLHQVTKRWTDPGAGSVQVTPSFHTSLGLD